MLKSASRRRFLLQTTGAAALSAWLPRGLSAAPSGRIRPMGPGSSYRPVVRAAFVRREGEYGMRWPGAIYDGETAQRNYTRQIEAAAADLGIEIELLPTPIHSREEAGRWVEEAQAQPADGLLVVLLDRQEHAWPTAELAASSKIPAVIFAPIGAAFTTNTWNLAKQPGALICSTDDFRQVAFSLKMLRAGTRLREMRYIVLRGDERRDTCIPDIGTRLRYVPASSFLEEYRKTPEDDTVRDIAQRYLQNATDVRGPTEQDVCNGVRSYLVARRILEREEGDGITMDCLGALGQSEVSLPCISWSSMLDDGVPAACEADLGAAVTHALVQYLFDRPGFQQDPVPETARNCLIGAHCTCPTRLRGFSQPAEAYFLSYHHGKRDAVPVPQWKLGERVTVADVMLADRSHDRARMVISAGQVVENVSVPPAGGCVVSVMVELDGDSDMLSYPGFHQIFFYGDFKRQLQRYSQLFDIEPVVV